MKFIICLLCMVFLGSCRSSTSSIPVLHVMLINDVTDTLKLRIDEHALLQRFNLSQQKSAKVKFTYAEISNTRLAPTISIVLPTAAETDEQNSQSQPYYREHRILEFYDTIRHALSLSKREGQVKANSECYRTICKQLHYLAAEPSEEKLMLITSNLGENSSILTVYSKRFSKLILRPSSIDSIFEEVKLLPDSLHSVTVIIIYQPLDREDDTRFAVMADVYTRLLTKRGARVIVQADNKNYRR